MGPPEPESSGAGNCMGGLPAVRRRRAPHPGDFILETIVGSKEEVDSSPTQPPSPPHLVRRDAAALMFGCRVVRFQGCENDA